MSAAVDSGAETSQMTDAEVSPFVPGARVAINDGWENYRESFVDKVYKSGRFTLKDGGPQQWRPSSSLGWGEPRIIRWYAHPTGKCWNRSSVLLWDETTNTEIKAKLDDNNRTRRIRAIRDRFQRMRSTEITNEQLYAIEAALPARKAQQ